MVPPMTAPNGSLFWCDEYLSISPVVALAPLVKRTFDGELAGEVRNVDDMDDELDGGALRASMLQWIHQYSTTYTMVGSTHMNESILIIEIRDSEPSLTLQPSH